MYHINHYINETSMWRVLMTTKQQYENKARTFTEIQDKINR